MILSLAASSNCVYYDAPSPSGDATFFNDRLLGTTAKACNFFVNNSDTTVFSHLKFNNGRFIFSANPMSNTVMVANNVEQATGCAYDYSAATGGSGRQIILGGEFELTGADTTKFFPICGTANVPRLRAAGICVGSNPGNIGSKCGDTPIRGFQAYDDFLSTQSNVFLNENETNDFQAWVQTFTNTWGNQLLTGTTGQTISSNGVGAYYVNVPTITSNYTVSAGCTLPTSGGGFCVIGARLSSPSATNLNGYDCKFTQGTGVALEKESGSGPTVTPIGTTDTTFTSGFHTIAIKVVNSTLTCLIDGIASTSATGTDSTYTAGFPWIGLYQGSGSGYLINFPFTVQ